LLRHWRNALLKSRAHKGDTILSSERKEIPVGELHWISKNHFRSVIPRQKALSNRKAEKEDRAVSGIQEMTFFFVVLNNPSGFNYL
jgi:hypothetical protein